MYPSLDAPVRVGEILASKYRVERLLGTGGMGVVVAATHLQLDQTVALKFIRCEHLKPGTLARFEREARTAARLKSDHVARVIDVGLLDTGSPYIVMEYLEGQDLAAVLQKYGTIPVPSACGFIIQACDALAEAHALGVVHRDLKPGNLFLASTSHDRQTIKVLDFGISKTQMSTDLSTTRTQDVMGSPGYMSPEQMRSTKNVDARSDIWSLGIILYELIIGQVPFCADTITALCLRITMGPLPPLPALPIARSDELAAVIRGALEKDPDLRYQSAVELARALAPFADPESRQLAQRIEASPPGASSASRMIPAVHVVTTLTGATGQVGNQSGSAGGSRKLLFAVVAVTAAAAFGVGIGVILGSRAGDTRVGETRADKAPAPASDVARPVAQPSESATRPGAPATAETAQVPAVPDTPAGSQAGGSAEGRPDAAAAAKPSPDAPRKPVTSKKPVAPSRPPASSSKTKRDPSKDKVKPKSDAFDPYAAPD